MAEPTSLAGPKAAGAPTSDSRPDLRPLIPETARRVLEIGCGTGALGRALKAQRPELEVIGVEADAQAAAQAERWLDAVHTGALDTLALPHGPGTFDTLVFADVLARVPNAEATLAHWLPYLRDDGHVVLSLPNVRHADVLADLLLRGRFTYGDTGLLDRRHLRLYTYAEIVDLAERAGLNFDELSADLGELNFDLLQALAAAAGSLGADRAAVFNEAAVREYMIRLEKPAFGRPVVRGPRRGRLGLTPAPRDAAPIASLVVLTLNQLELTRQCFESVLRHSTVPFELIVIDNGSSDDTPAYLRALAERDPRVRLHFNATNMGFGHGCNQGMAMAEGEFIVLLNNDTVVTEGWLEGLLKPMVQEPTIGASGPRSNRASGLQQLPFVPYGGDMAEMQQFARWYSDVHQGQAIFVPRLIGFCCAIRGTALQRIGGFDTRFGIGNFEDDDLSMRLKAAGFKLCITEEVFIHHYGSATFISERIDYNKSMAENWHRFAAKWGLEPSAPPDAYPLERFANLRLDPARDVVPILVPEAPPAPIAQSKGFHFLALPDWGDLPTVTEAIAAFAQTFDAQDDVALLLWVDPNGPRTTAQVAEALGPALAARGIGGEGCADLVLFDAPGDALRRARIYRAAQALLPLGDPTHAEAARACGLQVLPAVSVEALKAAVAR